VKLALHIIVGAALALALTGGASAHSPHVTSASHSSAKAVEARQVRALAHYKGYVRFWINHRRNTRELADGNPPFCKPMGMTAPRIVCWHAKAAVWTQRELLETRSRIRVNSLRRSTPQQVICTVFGSHCQEALRVSRCESGYSVNAQNGQYLGLFQMGSGERARYGHASDPWTQARAAHAYFVASGSDWSPWSCKPW
jgi:hypothetical protein